ncbi:universal stress protein [Actinoplanes italicus]|uniref:Nucleotide-binding universal stress UspA family protein n=1 Tax=Actinoplanes italicus TaxID=113567 RepID=A0A2T0KEV3_9ACTN|nr:universal stress protein [Actinoplanes italicus]PRX21845.1 nucleotide-binding universal stress UspA family protein [Actinoplanes italicus]GIE29738.1 universal stress protein [Actinoplanes italicus]
MQKKIIVGYDGSPGSHAATAWALEEAERAEAPVELLYADEWPVYAPAASMMPSPALRPQSYVDEVITGMMDRAVAGAVSTHPLVDVTATTVRAQATAALIERSRHARLMVLGVRANTVVAGLFGSVVSAVAAHAHCPVVVVRGDPPGHAPVVAGVDDSAAAPGVLAFAARQATALKVPLQVIHAWPAATGTVPDADRQSFAALVAEMRESFPDLRIEAEAVVDDPAGALTAAGTAAQVLVVGSRGRGAFLGLLGSVSQHLIRHSACPVAVVHG